MLSEIIIDCVFLLINKWLYLIIFVFEFIVVLNIIFNLFLLGLINSGWYGKMFLVNFFLVLIINLVFVCVVICVICVYVLFGILFGIFLVIIIIFLFVVFLICCNSCLNCVDVIWGFGVLIFVFCFVFNFILICVFLLILIKFDWIVLLFNVFIMNFLGNLFVNFKVVDLIFNVFKMCEILIFFFLVNLYVVVVLFKLLILKLFVKMI